MRILTFSTLYPNASRPSQGLFVETRLRQLLSVSRVQAQVVAPVPWFPSAHPRYGRYAAFASVPKKERRHGIQVSHPRFVSLPKIGMTIAPLLLANAVQPVLERIAREGYKFDLIDAHYFYPDGVAAAILGKRLGVPVVITARGSDLTLLPQYILPRKMIQWAARNAAGLVTVCAALKQPLIALGVPATRITVLRNGVDLSLFTPVDRDVARRRLGFRRPTLLSVGNLVPLKGHDLTIRALASLPGVDLVIAGDGPQRSALEVLVRTLGLIERVKFVGVLSQHDLRYYYGAADALVLASSREGWANVLLESMACGTPVIASSVWGTPEVVTAPEAGVLLQERTPQAIATAVTNLLADHPDRAATRRYAERFNWDDTSHGQVALFERVLGRTASRDVVNVVAQEQI